MYRHEPLCILKKANSMNFQFDESIATHYKKKSQKIRVMSESWLVNNAFCPCCGNERISKMKNNLPVADAHCGNCGEIFELKSKQNRIGKKIIDGEYHKMIERITSNLNPQLFVMKYSATLSVTDLILIPKFFFTPDIIEKRKPLSDNARRAGWVGCNILYQKIPAQGKIGIICDGRAFEFEEVVRRYDRIRKLHTNNLTMRGWMMDILNCVNNISSETFTLKEIYEYADVLRVKHSQNNNVEEKIRQQLQFLRDKGFIEFIRRGVYRKVDLS